MKQTLIAKNAMAMETTQIGNKMNKYVIHAISKTAYRIETEAEDEADAMSQFDEWLAEDFEDYKVDGVWEFEVLEIE
jgi:hypothetical protein